MEISACLRAGSSLRNCDRLCHWKRVSGNSDLFQRRNSHTDGACCRGKEQNFFTYRSHQRSGSPHRREEHSLALVELHLQWRYPLALELVLHSAIVTDFAIGKECPEIRICFKEETVTRTEHASEGKNKISSLIGHTNGVAPPIAEKSIHWLLLNSTYNGVIRLP